MRSDEQRRPRFWIGAHPSPTVSDAPLNAPVEWEYGIRPVDDDAPLGLPPFSSQEEAVARANKLRGSWVVVRRRKAGPWESTDGSTPITPHK